jgi:2-hydroxy-3-keto-5-methylthiopentenyl-1-phosphate phosphatase
MTPSPSKVLPSQAFESPRQSGQHPDADHSGPGDEKRWVVLCDFDGTITPELTLGVVYIKYAAPVYQDATQRWRRNEIGTQEEFEICFGAMKATRAELESALDTVAIDPGFPAFLNTCRRQGYEFAVVSEGLTWYVDHILARHGISALTVYSNEIHFDPDGFRFSYPWHAPEFPLRGVSKPGIVRRYQAQGLRVAYVGDGQSDYEAVPAADVVYARDGLLDHCRAQSIPAVGFVDMADLLTQWTLQRMDPAAVHARGADAGRSVSG